MTIAYQEVYSGLWVALLVLGVDRFPREYGSARMQSALSRYREICRDDAWAAENLPVFQSGVIAAEDAFKSALAWGYSAGFCREDVEADEVVIEIEEDLYRHSLSHYGSSGPDFHRAMLEFARAFSKGLPSVRW